MKIKKMFAIIAVVFAISFFTGCGGGPNTLPSATSTPPITTKTPNNVAFSGMAIPNSAYVGRMTIADLATATIDMNALYNTNCTWHTQMDLPKDSAASIVQAIQSILPYVKDNGYIEKNLHTGGEVGMLLASYNGPGVGAEYLNNQAILYQQDSQFMGSVVVY